MCRNIRIKLVILSFFDKICIYVIQKNTRYCDVNFRCLHIQNFQRIVKTVSIQKYCIKKVWT